MTAKAYIKSRFTKYDYSQFSGGRGRYSTVEEEMRYNEYDHVWERPPFQHSKIGKQLEIEADAYKDIMVKGEIFLRWQPINYLNPETRKEIDSYRAGINYITANGTIVRILIRTNGQLFIAAHGAKKATWIHNVPFLYMMDKPNAIMEKRNLFNGVVSTGEYIEAQFETVDESPLALGDTVRAFYHSAAKNLVGSIVRISDTKGEKDKYFIKANNDGIIIHMWKNKDEIIKIKTSGQISYEDNLAKEMAKRDIQRDSTYEDLISHLL